VDPRATVEENEKAEKKSQTSYENQDLEDDAKKLEAVKNQQAWWQWFEFSPFQIGSDELECMCFF
jgi:hypothetical protein